MMGIFPASQVADAAIKRDAQEVFLSGGSLSDCPYRSAGMQRELWIASFARAGYELACA